MTDEPEAPMEQFAEAAMPIVRAPFLTKNPALFLAWSTLFLSVPFVGLLYWMRNVVVTLKAQRDPEFRAKLIEGLGGKP